MSNFIIKCISASKRAILKIYCISNVIWVKEFIPPTPISVTLTDDLEIQGPHYFECDLILHILL